MNGFKPLIFFILFFAQSVSFSQPGHIRFDRITINDGLSLSSVYEIFQDSKGFMWFGTEDGLNKYDGQQFKVFRPKSGELNSLSYRWTELIFEDSRGYLWFGSKGGLTRFNPVFETFQQYRSNLKNSQLTNDSITHVLEQDCKVLWVGTISGLNMIDLSSGDVELKLLEGLSINTLALINDWLWVGTNDGLYINDGSGNLEKQYEHEQFDHHVDVNSITRDDEGLVWFAAGSQLMHVVSPIGTYPLVIEKVEFSNRINPGQIEQILIDHKGLFWLSCSDGLYTYEQTRGELKLVVRSIDLSHSLAINANKSIRFDSENNIWYGTHGSGIYVIDTQTKQYTNFRNNSGELSSLSENTINCIYKDRSDNMWIGTFGAGISIFRPDAHKFGFINHQPFNENTLSSNFIWSIMECDDGKIWIGTDDAGLNIYDPVLNQFTNYVHDPRNPNSLSNSSVRKVYQDGKKRIWIGTDGGGLNRFYPEKGRFVAYKNSPNNPTSISGNSVRVIYEDRDENLWVGTRSGLNLFDPATGSFRRYVRDEADENSLSNDFVYSAIYHDRQGNLWIGTYGGGLNMLDIKSGKFSRFMNNPSDPESISDDIVFSIHEESEGIFWIGTNSGLNRFDLTSESFEQFGVAQGLPNEVIYGMLSDDTNHLWLSTNRGICRFHLDNFSTKNFTVNDGLQSNEFNGGAFHKGPGGLMYFGGVYGLNIIDPQFSYIKDNKSQTVITNFEVLGNQVITSSNVTDSLTKNLIAKTNDNYCLPRNISYSKDIYLDYQYRFFSIEFAALNNVKDDDLKFQYFMEGLGQDWQDTGNRNFVSFANMQPGEYNFSVRSVNLDGFIESSNASLKIVIAPPFWKTWWFYLLEILLIVSVLVFAYKYLLKIRTNNLLRVQNEKVFQANQKLVESEKNLKHLNATKDKFFSIISHDLKNPFTSLLSISELMATDYDNLEEDEKELGIKRVHDSGKRIYRLLENLLTWSRAQSGRVSFKPVQLDLEQAAKENIRLMEETAMKKNIRMQMEVPESASAFCDKDMLDTIMRNLLNNAIKFSHEGESVALKINNIVTSWKISVQDHGIGMTEEEQSKVFRIDAKFKKEGTSGEKGTGLGLIICKEFVEKNGGKIAVTSNINEGSVFTFTVPKTSSFVQ